MKEQKEMLTPAFITHNAKWGKRAGWRHAIENLNVLKYIFITLMLNESFIHLFQCFFLKMANGYFVNRNILCIIGANKI